MKRLFIFILLIGLLSLAHVATVHASWWDNVVNFFGGQPSQNLGAATSTIVKYLILDPGTTSPTACLKRLASGLVATSSADCGSGTGTSGSDWVADGTTLTASSSYNLVQIFGIASSTELRVGSATVGNTVFTPTGFTLSGGQATTTGLTVTGITNALHLGSANGTVGGFTGSACGGSDQAISISATGTLICTAQGAGGGAGTISTSTIWNIGAVPFVFGTSSVTGSSTVLRVVSSTALFEVGGLPFANGTVSTTRVNFTTATGTSIFLTTASTTNLTFLNATSTGNLSVGSVKGTTSSTFATALAVGTTTVPIGTSPVLGVYGVGTSTLVLGNASTSKPFCGAAADFPAGNAWTYFYFSAGSMVTTTTRPTNCPGLP